MRKRISAPLLVLCLAGAAFTSEIFAQDATGFYIGGNFGFTKIDAGNSADELRNELVAIGFSSATVSIDETDTGFKFLAGYQVNPNFAVEAYYANLGTYELAVGTTGPATSGRGDVEVTGLGIDIVGMIPFNQALSGFARVGLFRFESEAQFSATGPGATFSGSGDDDGTEVKFGIGVEWALSRNLRVRGEFEYYNFEEKLTMLSAGVVFRF